MVQRVARAEPRCRQLAACSLQRSPAAVFATRTANIKQLLAKAE